MYKPPVTDRSWSEERLQQECFRWFTNTYPSLRGLLFHVPNGGTRNAREAAKFKTIGLVKGVADLVFLYRGEAYFIELKRPNGRGTQSPAQKKWEELVKGEGFDYLVIRTLENFILIIEGIIYKN